MVLVVWILVLGCSVERPVLPPTNPWIEEQVPAPLTFQGVPVEILDRLIQSESSWRPWVENKSPHEHSVGLAQVNLRWLPYFREKYGLQDPRKPSEALSFAARYLQDLRQITGSWYEAVLAYKCGLDGRHAAPPHIRRIAWWVVYGKEP